MERNHGLQRKPVQPRNRLSNRPPVRGKAVDSNHMSDLIGDWLLNYTASTLR